MARLRGKLRAIETDFSHAKDARDRLARDLLAEQHAHAETVRDLGALLDGVLGLLHTPGDQANARRFLEEKIVAAKKRLGRTP